MSIGESPRILTSSQRDPLEQLPESLPLEEINFANVAAGILGYGLAKALKQRAAPTTHFMISDGRGTPRGLVTLPSERSATDPEQQKSIDQSIKSQTQAVRNRLRDLSLEQRGVFNMTMHEHMITQNGRTPYVPERGWGLWLANVASPEQVARFAVWNVARIAEKQSQRWFIEANSANKAIFKRGVERGITYGGLDPEAESARDKVDMVKIMMSDVTDMEIKNQHGYAIRNTYKGYIREANGPHDMHALRKTILHEFGHLVLGYLPDTQFDEALTEHSAHAIQDGMWNDISPYNRIARGNYVGCRRFVAAFGVPVDYWAWAYSARSPEHRQLRQEQLAAQMSRRRKRALSRMNELMDELRQGLPTASVGLVSGKIDDACMELAPLNADRSHVRLHPALMSGNPSIWNTKKDELKKTLLSSSA